MTPIRTLDQSTQVVVAACDGEAVLAFEVPLDVVVRNVLPEAETLGVAEAVIEADAPDDDDDAAVVVAPVDTALEVVCDEPDFLVDQYSSSLASILPASLYASVSVKSLTLSSMASTEKAPDRPVKSPFWKACARYALSMGSRNFVFSL